MAAVKRTDRPVYVDIDGTLTTAPKSAWGPVIQSRIDRVRELCNQGYQVVLWTGGGTKYAERFAKKHNLPVTACLGKPEACIDDNPDIRPRDRMAIIPPETFFD